MNLDNLKSEIKIIDTKRSELKELVNQFKRIILIGNGGSNAISSHISIDYTKFMNKQAFSFSDAPMLTAYINDYGRDEAYKRFLMDFTNPFILESNIRCNWDEQDSLRNYNALVILISSSGNSMNVVNAAQWCEDNNVTYAALSGFNANNKLNNMNAKFKYHVNYNSYGVVELSHEILLHSIFDN